MMQNRESGAAARKWGLETARKIAKRIGVEMVAKNSNEIIRNGNRDVIKCAKQNTNKVGVTDSMVLRIDFVIGAFEYQPDKFNLWELPIESFKAAMKVTSEGKPNMVERSHFENHARKLREISLSK